MIGLTTQRDQQPTDQGYAKQDGGRNDQQRWIGRHGLPLIVALFTLAGTAFAQGTLSPTPQIVFLDASGNPINNGKICTYAAGTSTPLATYSDSTLTTANANPIRTNSAGRPTTGGIYLSPTSYKFLVLTAGADGTCSTGTTVYTQDNVSAVPATAVGLDIPSQTAGEALSAGDVVYLSAGDGGLTAGRWYKADADLTYASSTATAIGVVPAAIASGATGTIRIGGRMSGLSGLAAGEDYYISATAGALTATSPTNSRFIGVADTTTSLLISSNPASTGGPRGPPPCGRLTLTTGVPVTIADVTAATTLYYAPYGGCNTVQLFDGSAWASFAFTQLSVAVPATTTQMYDVWVYNNAGTLALELLAWTNDTTRATALTTQDGVYVKTGALTRRYVGSFRTASVSGQTEDSFAKRYLWNYYNRVQRICRVMEATNTWTYTLLTWRQANAAAGNQCDFVIGVSEVPVHVEVHATASNDGAGRAFSVGIGEDSTSAPVAAGTRVTGYSPVANYYVGIGAVYDTFPAIGRHVYVWLEIAVAAGTTTWYGDDGGGLPQSGIQGWTQG